MPTINRRIVSITSPSHKQIPFAEYVNGIWRVWQHYNKDCTAGSFLELSSTGSVTATTIGPDGLIADTNTILHAQKAKL